MRTNKKKSLAEKNAAGTPLRNANPAPVTLLSEIPKPPAKFSVEARALWKKVCSQLIARRTLTNTAVYAVENFVLLQLAARAVVRDKHATHKARLDLLREARLAAEELGLGPVSHGKVQIPAGAVTDSADDQRWLEVIGEGADEKGGTKA